ncbi:MAG: glycosyltransferase family 1 protein [Chloroherpetonaceae bacterium]|nr:glycosyltransferase family 1 protein [Chloroherpetonaceae bacterium]
MHIAFVLLGNVSQDTGGRNYLINFIKAAATLNREEKWGHRFTLYLSPKQRHLIDSVLTDDFTVVEVPFSYSNALLKVFAEQVLMPFYLLVSNADIAYFPGNFITLFSPKSNAVAIRSMLYYHYPEAIDKARLYFRKFLTPPSAKLSQIIITPSEDIKNDVVNFLGIDASKIKVINHGVDTEMFQKNYHDEERESVFMKYGINKPFITYASALWRYKNQDKLILAFERLLKEKGLDYQLLIVGKGLATADAYEIELRELVKSRGLEGRVIFTGQLSHSELKYLYKYARVFAYPSGYESFGNPLFEAWASGVPVVSANVHSFPEMTENGACALMMNPRDVDAIFNALYEASTNEATRQRLIENGAQRVAGFSWKKCVRETIKSIESLIAKT